MSVAIVTGSNKSVGLEAVRALCKRFSGDTYLTSRDEREGKDAIEYLKKDGLDPKFQVLDIGKEESVIQVRDFMTKNYGGIDILVNNAAIFLEDDSTQPFGIRAKDTLAINYWASKRTCEILFPVLKPGARVVNMASSWGHLGNIIGEKSGDKIKAEKLRSLFADPDLSVETLDGLMKNYVETAEDGSHGNHGWPHHSYIVSKIGLSALSRIQQRMMNSDPRDDIVVNFVNHCKGADPAVYAALLPPKTEIRGAYIWHDCQVVDWANGSLPTE